MPTLFQTRLIALQRNLLNFAYSLTANRDDAYDLLQDTTLKVLDSESKYRNNTNFKGWVFTIMRNLFINNYRISVRNTVVTDSTDEQVLLNLSGESTGYEPEGAITALEIRRALNSLPDDYRRPFALFLQGYKYKEIAARYGLPLGTVKSRIFMARQRMQHLLASLKYDR
ncbi:MAG: RNA polymerase sigma factor [Muribaculaceae bacterium]|nr:RNA polymerase sigma factor [Muribaculaceae bacterium]